MLRAGLALQRQLLALLQIHNLPFKKKKKKFTKQNFEVKKTNSRLTDQQMPLGYGVLLAAQLVLQQHALVPADTLQVVRQFGTDGLEFVFGLGGDGPKLVEVIRLVHVYLLGVLAEGKRREADAGLGESITASGYVARGIRSGIMLKKRVANKKFIISFKFAPF